MVEFSAYTTSDDQMFTVNGYKFIRMIGEGSFSKVFEVYSLRYRTTFCAKALQIENMRAALDDPELQILRNLDHPHVIRIYDSFVWGDYLFLIFELCSGGSLANVMETRRLRLPEITNWMREIVSALFACHSLGIAHRDIKPDNIFVDSYNHVKLADFGLSTMLPRDQPSCKGACGSPNYVAPEMLTEEHYDPFKADVWSLGVTLYEMVTGILPWSEAVTLHGAERGPLCFPIGIDRDMKRLIESMLRLDPNERASMKEISGDEIFRRTIDSCIRRKSHSMQPARSGRGRVSGQLLGIAGNIHKPSSFSLANRQFVFRTFGSQKNIAMALGPWQEEERRREKKFSKIRVDHTSNRDLTLASRFGVPAGRRSEIWFTASGGRSLANEVGELWIYASDGVKLASNLVYVGCECEFNSFPEKVREELPQFLAVVYKQNSDIQYAPMVPIVAAFLLSCMDLEQAYLSIQAMINRSKRDGWFFAVGAEKFSVSVLGILDVVTQNCRKVDQRAVSLGLSLLDLFRDTMMTFLIEKTGLNVALTIVDGYINEGKKVLLRIFLALLKIGEREFLAATTPGDFLEAFDRVVLDLQNVEHLKVMLKRAYGLRISRKGDIQSAEARIARLPNVTRIAKCAAPRKARTLALAKSDTETLMTEDLRVELRKNLEPGYRQHEPVLIYAMREHGTMFETMVEKASYFCPYILLIKTERQVLGAYLSDPPMNRGRNGSYFGRASTFVFRADPFIVYRNKPDNPVKKFISVVLDDSEKSLSVGGPGRAIYIENQLQYVMSWPCAAFESPPLVDGQERILDIELYRLGRGIRNAHTMDFSQLESVI